MTMAGGRANRIECLFAVCLWLAAAPAFAQDVQIEQAASETVDTAAIENRIRMLLREHMSQCWQLEEGGPDTERSFVTVAFELNQDGSLRRRPRVIQPRGYFLGAPMREAVDSAIRAVRDCDPFPLANDPVTGPHYDLWRRVTMTFARLGE